MLKRRVFISLAILFLIASQLACAQDCIGTTIYITGKAINSAGNKVSGAVLHITNQDAMFSEAFEETIQTDFEGDFHSGDHYVFVCDPIDIVIEADGYQTQTIRLYISDFYPPSGAEVPDYAPIELVITLANDN